MSSAASMDIVIIGAGLAGLTCAVSLARYNVNVTVLERANAIEPVSRPDSLLKQVRRLNCAGCRLAMGYRSHAMQPTSYVTWDCSTKSFAKPEAQLRNLCH